MGRTLDELTTEERDRLLEAAYDEAHKVMDEEHFAIFVCSLDTSAVPIATEMTSSVRTDDLLFRTFGSVPWLFTCPRNEVLDRAHEAVRDVLGDIPFAIVGYARDHSDELQAVALSTSLRETQAQELIRKLLFETGVVQYSLVDDEDDEELQELLELDAQEEAQDEIALQEYLQESRTDETDDPQ